MAKLGWRFYLIWVFFNAIFVPVCFHLEDIHELYWEDKSMIFVFRNKEAIQVERPQRFIARVHDAWWQM